MCQIRCSTLTLISRVSTGTWVDLHSAPLGIDLASLLFRLVLFLTLLANHLDGGLAFLLVKFLWRKVRWGVTWRISLTPPILKRPCGGCQRLLVVIWNVHTTWGWRPFSQYMLLCFSGPAIPMGKGKSRGCIRWVVKKAGNQNQYWSVVRLSLGLPLGCARDATSCKE
jgi:hypothetical protein